MNPEPTPTPREQIEMRLTALLMGELSAEETVALHALMAADPELARLHARLRQAMALLREATAEPEPATPTPARLSSERRERLLAHFKGPAPQPATIVKAPPRDWSWVLPLGVAASVVFILAGLSLPTFSRARRSGNAARTLAESATEAVIGQIRGADEKAAWASQPGQVRTYDYSGQASQPNDKLHLVVDLTKSGSGALALAPAGKSQSSALYLPPTTDAPASGEPAAPPPMPGASMARAGGGAQTPDGTVDSSRGKVGGASPVTAGNRSGSAAIFARGVDARLFDDLNHPVFRDGVQPDAEQIAASSSVPVTPPIAPPPLASEPALPILGDIPFVGRLFSTAGKPSAPQSNANEYQRSPQDSKPGDQIVLSTAKSYEGATVISGGTLALNRQTDATVKNAPVSGGRRNASMEYQFGNEAPDNRERLAADGAAGKKQNHTAAFPVTPTTPPAFEKGELAGDLAWTLDPALPATEFEGFINYGTPITKEPAEPAAPALRPDGSSIALNTRSGDRAQLEVVREFRYLSESEPSQKPAAQSGKNGRDKGELAAHPAGGEKQPEIETKHVEITQNNLKELSYDWLLGRRSEGEAEIETRDQKTGKPPTAPGALPVEAVSVLRDGTFMRGVDPRGPNASHEAKENPVVGTVKFWTDDETAKVNINTASEGTHWDEAADPRRPANKAEGEKMQQPVKMLEALQPDAPEEKMELAPMQKLPKQARLYKTIDELRLEPNEQAKEWSETKPDAAKLKERAAHAVPAATPKPVEVAKPQKQNQLAQQAEEMDEKVPAEKPAQPAAIPQPEVATSANAFSTFSLNVSDVAFKLAAASLEQGKMPELATVRSEEFINAFDYRDPEPAAGAPLAFAAERARYPFAQNRDLLRLSVKTAAAGRQPGRPLNLVLLLDNSGSMERADRVRILREALRVLAAQLQPQDRLSVVTFARTPRLWADGVAGDKAAEAVARVGEITPQGGTNLAAALDLGYATALKHCQPGSISRVVLLTDGAANLGDVNPDALKRKVETNRQRGVALDCFGIGWEGYDDTLLETLARHGDGRYGFINTPEEAASGFAAQLAGALRVAASDVKVQVEWNPRRVTAYRQIGYAKHQLKKEQFRDNSVDAAEIGAAESGNALYVVEVNPRGTGDLATVRVRFKVPGTADYQEHEWTVPFTPNTPSLEQASPALRLAGTASAFSEWLVASPYAAEVTPDRLLGLLNGVPAIYPADPRPKKLEWMIRTAKSVSGR